MIMSLYRLPRSMVASKSDFKELESFFSHLSTRGLEMLARSHSGVVSGAAFSVDAGAGCAARVRMPSADCGRGATVTGVVRARAAGRTAIVVEWVVFATTRPAVAKS